MKIALFLLLSCQLVQANILHSYKCQNSKESLFIDEMKSQVTFYPSRLVLKIQDVEMENVRRIKTPSGEVYLFWDVSYRFKNRKEKLRLRLSEARTRSIVAFYTDELGYPLSDSMDCDYAK